MPEAGRTEVYLARSLARRLALECEVCGGSAVPAGRRASVLTGRRFALARCPSCGFAFVVEPRTDFDVVYDDAYYAGRGADPSVDYAAERDEPRTVRLYEWRGVLATVRRLHQDPMGRWLDFGSGYGGLVRYLREAGIDAVGFDESSAVRRADRLDVPMLDEDGLDAAAGTFDVVTAIEVLEHVLDPVTVAARVARLLAPGGTLFVTTGNVAPHRNRLNHWSYVVPDVHVSFFEPRTLVEVYRASGLEAVPVGYGWGMAQIIRYKVLKALGRRHTAAWERAVPWALAGRVVDRRHRVSDQPAARRPLTV